METTSIKDENPSLILPTEYLFGHKTDFKPPTLKVVCAISFINDFLNSSLPSSVVVAGTNLLGQWISSDRRNSGPFHQLLLLAKLSIEEI